MILQSRILIFSDDVVPIELKCPDQNLSTGMIFIFLIFYATTRPGTQC